MFEPKVLNDVGMIEILEKLDLGPESSDGVNLTIVRLIRESLGHFDLFDGDHLSGGSVETKVDSSILQNSEMGKREEGVVASETRRRKRVEEERENDEESRKEKTYSSLPDEISLHPLERSCRNGR